MALDLGTKSLGAVLFNQLTGQSYPVYWETTDSQTTDGQVEEAEAGVVGSGKELDQSKGLRYWRLPAIAQIATASPANTSQTTANPNAPEPGGLVPALSDDIEIHLPQPGQPVAEGLLICDLKAALDIGLPYFSEANDSPEPRLQWFLRPAQGNRKLSQAPTLPLRLILRSLEQLLSSLQPALPERDRPWRCGALDLSPAQVSRILSGLEGVMVNSPTRCSEAYRFNLREAILGAKLVERPEQVAFLEEPLAALLGQFQDPALSPLLPLAQGPQHWPGATLVIHSSASATELALACLPQGLHNLSREDLHLRSLAYGNQAYLQDIACQLLYPFIPEDQIDLDLAILPLPGEVDGAVRSQLQRQLYQSASGAMLMEAAGHLNRALQKQDRITFELGPHRSSFSQTALDTKVTQPFLLRLNREVTQLLSQAGLAAETVAQVLCTGSGETLGALQQWLVQKLPQAKVITDVAGGKVAGGEIARENGQSEGGNQDRPSGLAGGDRPNVISHRIAYGLACLPLYPQLLNRKEQQYNDYFLLTELLRCLPDEALTLGEILNQLEGRGINSQACRAKVEAILAGRLPAGLIPQASDDIWILESRQNPDYQALEAPLFWAVGETAYQVDPAQRQRFWQYWQQVMAHSHQSLEEPYILQVGLSLAE